MEPWFREKLLAISQRAKLAEAIRYALSRWDGLTHFVDGGRVEIDSNARRAFYPPDRAHKEERALRRI